MNEANDFIESQKNAVESGSFWQEWYKSTVIKHLETMFKPEIIEKHGISDIIINGDKILIKWYKKIV